ncbi:PREDICTED: HCLS1-binding protein 3, partial [Buceros rhinoceros silvestris]|uniref:HCLS1-binding protein 3 n=1 Tax=Buceros rhinoceros silvestris TaxID=175836 RepID=UPI000528D4B3
VSKKYSEIEELYQRLVARYPQVSLPLLPRKVLFVGESDICERRAMFHDIMKFISKHEDLATCPELLEFLGTKSTSAIDFKSKNIPDDKEKAEEENEALDFFKEEKTPDLISELSSMENDKKGEKKEEEEEEEDLDPLGIIRTKKTKKASAPPTKKEKPKLTIFEAEVDPDEGLFGPEKDFSSAGPRKKMKENLKLFEDPELGGVVRLGDSLLLPAACKNREFVLNTGPEEDTEELLRVEDDLEKLLNITSKPKPKVPPKPPLPQKPAVAPRSTNSSPLAKPKEDRIQTMNEVDILQYIQENESINNQDTSLF